MSLEAFLHNLHFDIDQVSSANMEVDWEDAPLTYKLYRGLPVVPLSLELPLTITGQDSFVMPNLSKIGHFLWYVFGLTQFSQSVYGTESKEQAANIMQSYRRFVPSGGALYPNELYVYLKLEDLPAGVYHYDVAHHRLVLLREGNFDLYIEQALGHRCDMSSSFGTVFISVMFWKNFFKYNKLSYRLQGLDTGVLIGQLLEVAKRFKFSSSVYFQFLDQAINHLLGLSEKEESVYAVISLSEDPAIRSSNESDVERSVISYDLSRKFPTIRTRHYIRSKKIKEDQMLTKMNEAAMLESTQSFRKIAVNKSTNGKEKVVALPQVKPLSYDLASVCKERYSPDMDFILGKVSQLQLATLLQEAMNSFKYRNDLDREQKQYESRVSLHCCLYNVEGIPDGAYHYDSTGHSLKQVNLGDHRLKLQSGMSMDNVNLFQVPLCLHIVGDKDHYKKSLGYRGYRIQQMEAGMLLQQLVLVATAIGMGGHPLLGFDANLCDKIYNLDIYGKTSLIQIPVGPYRPRAWLRGSLQS